MLDKTTTNSGANKAITQTSHRQKETGKIRSCLFYIHLIEIIIKITCISITISLILKHCKIFQSHFLLYLNQSLVSFSIHMIHSDFGRLLLLLLIRKIIKIETRRKKSNIIIFNLSLIDLRDTHKRCLH